MMTSKVYLVGAGPGDVELLTLKACRVIQEADVILYDKLVNPEILKLSTPRCELIYVGKEPGKPCRSQPEINELLVDAARRHAKVVRLKGGDPLIFGRGSEEAMVLREHEIAFEIIPGVSSIVAAPAYAGIPLTHRKMACSFAVITGHEAPGKEETQIHWGGLAEIETLVFLMSVGNRKEIAEQLIRVGRPSTQSVAFIENGTTERQRLLKTTLSELATTPIEVSSPAVMVVGPVVDLSDDLSWFSTELLATKIQRTVPPVSLVQ